MFELFKKIGIPATIAAVISAIVTIIPFLFKLDERYAKASELEQAIAKVDVKVNALNTEVGKLNGITQVLIAVVGQTNGDSADLTTSAPTVSAPVSPASHTKPLVVEKVELPQIPTNQAEQREALHKAKKALEASQRNIKQIQTY